MPKTIIDNTPSPIQEIKEDFLDKANVRLFIKREDLLRPIKDNPHISGNKWRKLKYNILQAQQQGLDTLLTFGGAYSNHLHATAAVGKAFGFKTIGVVRGEEHKSQQSQQNQNEVNSTLQFCINQGMHLHYISRTDFRKKTHPEFIQKLKQQFGNFYLLPEGGTNAMAIKGCTETVKEIDIPYNYLCCPCGTGGTIAGLIVGTQKYKQHRVQDQQTESKQVLGFSALKGDFLKKEVEHSISDLYGQFYSNWSILSDYHFGGYAKVNETLFNFIITFNTLHQIQLEPIYTGKMMYGIYHLINKGYFPEKSSIIALHTGGLQGLNGFPKLIFT